MQMFVLDFEEIYVNDSEIKSIFKAKFWCGYLFVIISFNTAMTILLVLLVNVEWLFASLPLEFFFFSFLFVLPAFEF